MAKKNNKRRKAKPLEKLVSYGDFKLPPVVPGPEVNNLCNEVDNFYKSYPKQHRKQKASDLIKGAFYAARLECRSNPDWMSQAANSLRDVLYPLFSNQISKNNLIKLFRKYATNKYDGSRVQNKEFVKTFNSLDKIYKQLSDLTHHGTELKSFSEKQYINFSESDFDNLLGEFVSILGKAFVLQQIYIHTIINLIVQKKRKTKTIEQDLKFILSVNPDAHQYFYSKVDEHWLNWLWKNGFLDIIKQKAEDPTRYGYRTSELNYLARVAEKVPAKVVSIMLAVPISMGTFNPEVIDRFLRICSSLPANQLSRKVKGVSLMEKIRDERWIPLMGAFNRWGFEYEKIFETLAGAKDYKSLLVLAKAVLAVRTKEEIEKLPRRGLTDNPFYFDDFSYTKVFEYLTNISDDYAKEVSVLATGVMRKIILLIGEENKDEVFDVYDKFILLDVDFFEPSLGRRERLSHRDDIRQLAAVIKKLAERLIGEQCNKPKEARNVYKNHIGDFNDPKAKLPDSGSMWRLRLFVLSLCPEVFKKELKEAFFRLFETESYHKIISGAEYKKALREGFSALSREDKREYVKRLIEYFKKQHAEDREGRKQHLGYGARLFSMIADHLTEDEKRQIKEVGFNLDSSYEPGPPIGPVTSGNVVHRTAGTEDDWKKDVSEIVRKLKEEWSPEELAKKQEGQDFFRPLGGEGTGDRLKKEMEVRPVEFLENAQLFFARENLHPHYTYKFLQGAYDLLRNQKAPEGTNLSELIALIQHIIKDGKENPFEKPVKERRSLDWLGDWDAVLAAVADMVQQILGERDGKIIIDFPTHRPQLITIIDYLLSHPDPTPEDESPGTATMTVNEPGDKGQVVGDPFTMAINSVRGRAFQAFVLFVYQDGKKFSKEEQIKIKNDVKEIYQRVLKKENTRALMFIFGHYLPSFYFRDIKWIHRLLPQIFPEEPEKKHLYLAAWEGYLANNLYEEIFFDPLFQALYKRGLTLSGDEDPKRKYFRELDEGIAIHLALAFMAYHKKFGFEHALFRELWKPKNVAQQAKFISFIGRMFVSGDNVQANELLKKEPEDRKRLRKFWQWLLENYTDSRLFAEFGFWINLEKNIFELGWLARRVKETLTKTNGALDWDYGLTKSIIELAKASPGDTLEIARLYLYKSMVKDKSARMPFYDDEWFEAFKILYDNPKTKNGTYVLINNLIRDGGSIFWKLKDVINN